MKNKIILGLVFITLTIATIFLVKALKTKDQINISEVTGTIISISDYKLTIQDENNIIYTFNTKHLETEATVGSEITIKCSGEINKNQELQTCSITNYITKTSSDTDQNTIDISLNNSIFKDYAQLAENKIKTMTLEEKIGQLLLVRYPNTNSSALDAIKKYHLGGFVFFEKDFKDKTKEEVTKMIKTLQDTSSIPLFTAVDEEGGEVVRISSNPNLSNEKFKSPSELYQTGGFNLIKEDIITKSKLLNSLGLNLNLAPVIDVAESSAYIYPRTLKENVTLTSTYAQTVIEASKNTKVSYTLKHFPGYGNNTDTHTDSATDNRTYDEILNNALPPFKAGINAGAEAVLISHNTVTSIDSSNPASLSSSVHNLLRNELKFTGIIITDSIDMNAVSNITDVTTRAILAGNDLIITTDYETSFNELKNAVATGTISEEQISKIATRVIAWKYYKGLMLTNQK